MSKSEIRVGKHLVFSGLSQSQVGGILSAVLAGPQKKKVKLAVKPSGEKRKPVTKPANTKPRVFDELYWGRYAETAAHYLWDVYQQRRTDITDSLFGSPGWTERGWNRLFEQKCAENNKADFIIGVDELLAEWEPYSFREDYVEIMHTLVTEFPVAAPYFLVETIGRCMLFVEYSENDPEQLTLDEPYDGIEHLLENDWFGLNAIFQGQYETLLAEYTREHSKSKSRKFDTRHRTTLEIARQIVQEQAKKPQCLIR